MAGLNPCCPWAKAPNPTSVCATLMTPRTRQRITRSLNVFSHFCCHNMVYWNLGPTRRGSDVWEPIRALIDPVRPLNDSHVGNRYSLDTLCSYIWSLGYSGNPQLKKSSPHKHASKLHEWSTPEFIRFEALSFYHNKQLSSISNPMHLHTLTFRKKTQLYLQYLYETS